MLVNYIHKHYEYMLNTMLSFGLAIEPTHIKYIGKYTMINNVTYFRKTIIINKACHIFEKKNTSKQTLNADTAGQEWHIDQWLPLGYFL